MVGRGGVEDGDGCFVCECMSGSGCVGVKGRYGGGGMYGMHGGSGGW